MTTKRWSSGLIRHVDSFALRLADETWLRISVALVWLLTAVGVVHPFYREVGASYLTALGLPTWLMPLTCAIELVLGVVVWTQRPRRWLTLLQVGMILTFTLLLAVHEPLLLASPFGYLSKNLQILAILFIIDRVERDGAWSDVTRRWLRIAMAIVWITEGLFPKILFQQSIELAMVPRIGIESISPSILVGAMGVCQIASGILALVLTGQPRRLLLTAQALALIVLPLLVGLLEPTLYVHPFGPFLKNLPILTGTWLLRRW